MPDGVSPPDPADAWAAPVTLREVAEHAGVHPATVSRALNQQTQQMVSPDTLRRVLKSARELNYRTNEIARSLRTQRSLTVGVVIPDIANPLFPRIVRGIDDALEEVGYASLVAYTDGRDDRLVERFELLRRRGVDGLLVATARHSDPALQSLAAALPVVQINRRSQSKAIPSVTPDDESGIAAAVELLAGLGHARIALLAPPSSHSTGRARVAGFRAGMRRAGLAVPAGMVQAARRVTTEEGLRLCREVIQAHPDVTAILAGNDLMALGCYTALGEMGLRCPDDISIVGFNDMPFCAHFAPPLTTVWFDHYEVGAAAVGVLLRRLRSSDPTTSAVHLELETRLVVRGSTAPPRRR